MFSKFGLKLDLSVKLSSAKGLTHRQNRPSSSVEEFVNNKIMWREIEDQVVVKETGNRYFGHVIVSNNLDWININQSGQ